MPKTEAARQAAIEARYCVLREGCWVGDERRAWIPGDVEERLRKRAAREVDAEHAAALEVRRQQEYQRAEEAATAAGTPLNAEMRMHAYHLVDLALLDPIVTISWLRPHSASAKLVGAAIGVSLNGRGTIVTPAIRSIDDVNTAEHELGHQRTLDVVGKLEMEVAAWQWVLQHALYWDWPRHQGMCKSLGTYIDGAKDLRDVLGVQAIEQLCASFRQHERPKTVEMVQQFEARLFEQQHGRVRCQFGKWCPPGTIATQKDADKLVCATCALALKTDRSIRMQRMIRDVWRARKAACPGT